MKLADLRTIHSGSCRMMLKSVMEKEGRNISSRLLNAGDWCSRLVTSSGMILVFSITRCALDYDEAL